jgi:hypothetical protein
MEAQDTNIEHLEFKSLLSLPTIAIIYRFDRLSQLGTSR